jgi:hypothetical protein
LAIKITDKNKSFSKMVNKKQSKTHLYKGKHNEKKE